MDEEFGKVRGEDDPDEDEDVGKNEESLRSFSSSSSSSGGGGGGGGDRRGEKSLAPATIGSGDRTAWALGRAGEARASFMVGPTRATPEQHHKKREHTLSVNDDTREGDEGGELLSPH